MGTGETLYKTHSQPYPMLSLRYLAVALVFLAVIPVGIYLGATTYLALSLTCIALIAATLYLSFGPSSGPHEPAADAR